MENNKTNNNYSIPIYENGIKTEYTVDGEIGDEKYYEIIKFGKKLGEKGKLPLFINFTTVNPNDN